MGSSGDGGSCSDGGVSRAGLRKSYILASLVYTGENKKQSQQKKIPQHAEGISNGE